MGVTQKPDEELKVETYNWPFQFHVSSESLAGKVYTVDLEEFDGNGQCDCPNFRFSRQPKLTAKLTCRSRCKHIHAALAYFTEVQIAALSRAVGRKRKGAPPSDE